MSILCNLHKDVTIVKQKYLLTLYCKIFLDQNIKQDLKVRCFVTINKHAYVINMWIYSLTTDKNNLLLKKLFQRLIEWSSWYTSIRAWVKIPRIHIKSNVIVQIWHLSVTKRRIFRCEWASNLGNPSVKNKISYSKQMRKED